MVPDEQEPSSELREIVALLRENLRWQAASGALGVPRDPNVRKLASVPEPGRPLIYVPPHAPENSPDFRPPPQAAPPRLEVPAAAAPKLAPAAFVPSPPLPHDERERVLAELAAQVVACTKCPLHAGRTLTVFARGNPSSELMIIGEGPGAEEDQQGAPFVGPAGQLLDRMILAMGLGRDDVYIANIVKCRPPNNRTPQVDEISACMPFLHKQIEIVQPRVILAAGNTAVRALLGVTEGITSLRGKWKLHRGRIPVMPTYHPAYLLREGERQLSAKREVWTDLKAVLAHLGRFAPGKST